jgi:hypothetical protein
MAAGCAETGLTQLASVLETAAPLWTEGVVCAADPPVAVTAEPSLPAIASVPPTMTAGLAQGRQPGSGRA